jgi:hypothetical protein
MDHNWPYVAVGYTLMTVVLVSYIAYLWTRLRRGERSLSQDD